MKDELKRFVTGMMIIFGVYFIQTGKAVEILAGSVLLLCGIDWRPRR